VKKMFKRSFNKFLEKSPEKAELYPYVYSIGLGGLKTAAKKKITTQPIKCSQCGAVLTNIKLIKEDPNLATHFSCEFCGTVNVVDKVDIGETLPDDIDFIVEDIKPVEPKKEEEITGVKAADGDLYTSIIDISGSMSGGKIEAVKKSLVQTIKDFKMNAPGTKYILIAFESSVYYYLKHDQPSVNFSGDTLYNIESMRKEFENNYKKDEFIGSIGEFADGWVEKVQGLRSMDMTALGPALYFGILSFERFAYPSGRITLLTDGLANQGIGNLSGTSPGAQQFYDQMAELCNKLNIVVDVVGVSSPGDNNEMGLQTLGKLTDTTGGKLFLISSDEMEAIFTELRQTNYIGKDVKVKVITPTNINIKNVTGAFSSKSVEEAEISLGAVTEDRELYVELDSSNFDAKEIKEIPVQLQVEYNDNEGRKRLRVINDKVQITKDEKEFKTDYDQNLNVMMNIQQAGTSYYAGKAEDSKKMLRKLKTGIANEIESLQGAGAPVESFEEGLSYLDDELDEMEMEEAEVQQAPKASYQAAKGQVRARISKEKLKKRMESKKK
jgi:hypothetical protein